VISLPARGFILAHFFSPVDFSRFPFPFGFSLLFLADAGETDGLKARLK